MDLSKDFHLGTVEIIEGAPPDLVEDMLVEGAQAKVLTEVSHPEMVLGTILEDKHIMKDEPSVKAKGKRRAKTPLAAQVFNDSIRKMDQKLQALRELKEVIATDLAVVINGVAKEDKLLEPDWRAHHPKPLTKEEEISKRFATAYPNVGTSGASTLGRCNRPFCVFRTPNLYCRSWVDQGGFDK
uniref:Uncharacterized protein n=1 Tax=Cannabis sativa TaxID=3483 RepID=A0A803NIL5_CANSA